MNLNHRYLVSFRIIILIFLFSCSAKSQEVEILSKGEIRALPESKIFAFLEPIVNTGQIELVATIQAKYKGKDSVMEKLYFAIRKRATAMGATCYKVRSFTQSATGKETVLVLDCYYAGETVMKFNTDNHELNTIFIFGKESPEGKSVTFRLNGESHEIEGGTYFKYVMKEGEEVKISKGGFTGSALTINWKPEQQPLFYTLSGFGLSDANPPPMVHSSGMAPTMGVSITTGEIHSITNISLGLLMTQLLKQGN